MAPLAVGLTLSPCGPLHFITPVTNKADHVVEVEAVSHCATIYGTSWMATADRCREESVNHGYIELYTDYLLHNKRPHLIDIKSIER